jgi:plastocyanin
MSVTLSNINTAVDPFNDIPDITFDSIDVTAYTEEVEIYTNTPAVMIPSKLNAMALSMKGWLNDNVSAPLENQQNTFKNEVVVRTNTAMNAVETYMNDEVQGFVNSVFVPWANDAGNILSNHANLQEANVTGTLSQLQADYTAHVISQDALIAQALADMLANLAQYTTGASNSGYTVHQTNELMAGITQTREIAFSDYLYDYNDDVIFAHEGNNVTHHINYKALDGTVLSFGETMDIFGEPRPFVQHLRLEISPQDTPSVEKIKAYDIFKNTSAGLVNSFRGTGHEADGEPAAELTILNNQSVPDTDNPELILRRGNESALMWGGIDAGDYIKITEIDGTTIYNEGIIGNFAQDYDTILFKPHQSYCHDSGSAVTGWGIIASDHASDIDSSGGDHDTPLKCEEYVTSQVALLDDLSRSYEYNIAGESYDWNLSDGLIYKVFINDDTGFIDSYAYTVDANGKTGTGAILAAVYDDGVSDVTMTSGGTGYSVNAQARAFDLGAVDVAGSTETKSTATFTLKDGMLKSISLSDPGAGYTGYWEVDVADGGNGHTHKVHLTQTEVNLVMSGTAVISTTVEQGHSHDQTVEWNAFNSSFYFSATSGAHTHPLTLTTHEVNPTISAVVSSSSGGLATSTVYLKEDDTVDRVVVTDGGSNYLATDTVVITGGTPSLASTAVLEIVDGGIAGLSVGDQGTGYTNTTAKTVAVNIQNDVIVPSTISAVVGDTVTFTNLDISPHTITHIDGMFDSGDIPQNAVYSYVITKPTEITDKYEIHDTNNTSITATLWVRDKSVYVGMNSATGGGFRGIATVNSSGNVTNISVDRPGQGYKSIDSVHIVDVSGPGEGAFASVVTDRSVGQVVIDNGGTSYSLDTTINAFDPTGFADVDELGVLTGTTTYGSGTTLRPIFSSEFIPGYCADPAFTDQATCEAAFNIWNPEINIGQLTAVNIPLPGSGYNDIEFIINDPTGSGSGAICSADFNNVITDITFSSRGSNYDEPFILVSDRGGLLGSSTISVGTGFVGTVVLNNGIGGVSIVNDWQDYVVGQQRVLFVDSHATPTGYGAEATAMIGATGNVESITMTNSGTAYKTPLVMVAGPVLLTGNSINNVNTDLALYGPEGNENSSPFSSNSTSNTNFKNGIMIQFENPNGHTLNDEWAFKLQTWKLGTPASLLYTSSRYDANLENMRGIITLKDVWEV